MSFSIGSQQAGNINNVAGDQHIHGGQQGVLGADLVAALDALRDGLLAADLPAPAAEEARREAERVRVAVDQPEPDRPRAASALERLTRLLLAAGPLAGATAALVGPLTTLAHWLGPLGQTVLGLVAVL